MWMLGMELVHLNGCRHHSTVSSLTVVKLTAVIFMAGILGMSRLSFSLLLYTPICLSAFSTMHYFAKGKHLLKQYRRGKTINLFV